MLKENNGRAAARRWRTRKVILTLMITMAIITFVMLRVRHSSQQEQQKTVPINQRHLIHHHDAPKKQRHVIHNLHQEVVPKRDLQRILDADVHLIDLVIDHDELREYLNKHQFENESDGEEETDDASQKNHPLPIYDGVYGSFCKLNWSLHKNDPSSYPMFRDLVDNSAGCAKNKRILKVNIHDLVKLAREHDATTQETKVLDVSAVVFHESRCGSTLTANIFAAINPAAHRVYSESAPPLQALNQVCGEDYSICDTKVAASVLRDVMYLMSRSNQPTEERVFFKIQSVGTRNLPVFTTAFPDTPYLMVYREPVQVMMSHLKGSLRNANCVRQRRTPPSSVVMAVQKYTPAAAARSLPGEDYCAAHLASITETMVHHHTPNGIPINYESLPDILYTDILPWVLKVPALTTEQLRTVREVAAIYSKNRGGNRVEGTFQADSVKKEETASAAVRHAAKTYLLPSYQELERIAQERRTTIQEQRTRDALKSE